MSSTLFVAFTIITIALSLAKSLEQVKSATTSNIPKETLDVENDLTTIDQNVSGVSGQNVTVPEIQSTNNTTYFVDFIQNAPVPYFSGTNTYFTEISCTNQFLEFIKNKGNNVARIDIFGFLSEKRECKRGFSDISANKLTITSNPHDFEENATSTYVVRGKEDGKLDWSLDIDGHNKFLCVKALFDSAESRSNNSYASSAVSINNLVTVNNCTVKFSFVVPENKKSWFLSYPWVVYMKVALTTEITIVNTVVVFVFLQEEQLCPMLILLSGLAISNCLSVVFGTLPKFIGLMSDPGGIERNRYGSFRWNARYPECLVVGVTIYLSYAWHMTSIILTTALCAQKTAAMLFPTWSQKHINKQITLKASIVTAVVCIALYLPNIFLVTIPFRRGHHDTCIIGRFSDTLDTIYQSFNILHSTLYIVDIIFVVTCTAYICIKLTLLRRNLPWTDSDETRKRNQRSALLVVLICVIFLLSETMLIGLLLNKVFDYKMLSRNTYSTFQNYTGLALGLGYALNFAIYLAISERLRTILYNRTRKLCNRCCCYCCFE